MESSSIQTSAFSVQRSLTSWDTTLTTTAAPHLQVKFKPFLTSLNQQHNHSYSGFIGLVNFYHRFIPHCAELLHPLHQLLTSKTKSQELKWNETATTAFQNTKQALGHATLLVYPKSDTPTCVTTDASDIAVGAVLQQLTEGMWKPISFFSEKDETC